MGDFYCKDGSCAEIATYGYNSSENIFCKTHMLDDMVITFEPKQILQLKDYEFKKYQKCYFKTCNLKSSFNFLEKPAICCKKHSLNGMIDVIHPKCEKCSTRPSYNFEGKKNPIRCAKHIEEGMICLTVKMCITCLKVSAHFNYLDEDEALYCVTCKKEDMCNIISKKCQCGKHRPIFGNIDDTTARYCNECKKDNMIDIKNTKCQCGSRPSFNYEGLPAKFCAKCKLPDMVIIIKNICIVCKNTYANFNYADQEKAIHCATCKLENMVDIRNRKCPCGKTPSFNFPGEITRVYCVDCKEPGMISLIASMCITCNITQATQNYPGKIEYLYCAKCKLDGMIDVKTRTCKNDWCNTIANSKYENYCLRCFIHEHPDQKISKHYKIKERYVTDFIKEKFANYTIVFDKTTGGCSKRRPDAYIDLQTHIIIFECNENKHKYYDTACEIARINELFTDFGDRPIVFIMFNPDGYDDVLSSFKYHLQTGVPIIRDVDEWNNRLKKLKECIEKNIKTIPTETVFEYMFYDS